MGRNLISIRTLAKEDIEDLLALSADFKLRVVGNKPVPKLSDQVVGMLFFENSTRTRVSFEQAAYYLGMKTANFTDRSEAPNECLYVTLAPTSHSHGRRSSLPRGNSVYVRSGCGASQFAVHT